ncbi:pesticin C-terminus-like muramidase [Litoribrevibacter albus]|uniref:Pesticin C-terminal domain-containing protein n=1 Tax=Litoribrevibacter albus TaxID=1473156 RepID=A0AA37W6R0_9GAMM|nr:pesticin C-terminus-like muramidase [Litoribrevibacter albus]GLQ30194.1 hypothetical protein GCM10007876_06720 [Litoribrevibacter albus]
MPENIDYQFLSDLEGGSKINGYVPAAGVSKSGVTIATGFDLGQRSEADLKKLNLNAVLVAKLKPYLGLKSDSAQKLLKKTPLVITKDQAQAIDKAVKSAHIAQLKLKYNSASGNTKKFSDIPSQAQTVIASVSFQYGVGLNARAPKFWKAVTSQDWKETIKLLKAFGDAYPTRRKKEAALLEKIK